jgi:hypothetical protein
VRIAASGEERLLADAVGITFVRHVKALPRRLNVATLERRKRRAWNLLPKGLAHRRLE